MQQAAAVVAGALLGVGSPLAVLTALGSRRRGNRVVLALLAGLAYPVTWVLWYVRDARPFSRPRR